MIRYNEHWTRKKEFTILKMVTHPLLRKKLKKVPLQLSIINPQQEVLAEADKQ